MVLIDGDAAVIEEIETFFDEDDRSNQGILLFLCPWQNDGRCGQHRGRT